MKKKFMLKKKLILMKTFIQINKIKNEYWIRYTGLRSNFQ